VTDYGVAVVANNNSEAEELEELEELEEVNAEKPSLTMAIKCFEASQLDSRFPQSALVQRFLAYVSEISGQ
jgi:hypothetical protein